MGLSNILNKLMQESNINNLQLSRYTNVPVTNIVRMKKDDNVSPKTSSLKAIAEFFNISVDQLLGLQELPADKQKGIHTTVSYTAALLPIINWTDVTSFVKDPENFLKGKVLEWVSSTRDFADNSYAVRIPDNDRALFLKKDSIVLIEPLEEIKCNGLALFAEEDQQIELYQVIVDGKDIYIKSANPEIKGITLLPSNLNLLGSIAEIRFTLHEKSTQKSEEVKSILPFYAKENLADNEA